VTLPVLVYRYSWDISQKPGLAKGAPNLALVASMRFARGPQSAVIVEVESEIPLAALMNRARDALPDVELKCGPEPLTQGCGVGIV
jgi:hypothetical protein